VVPEGRRAGGCHRTVYLGAMYAAGNGVPQDYVQAHKWRNLAAAHSTGDLLTMTTKARDAIAAMMTPAQIAEAQKLAREWQGQFEKRKGE